jgi:hypothetical protein
MFDLTNVDLETQILGCGDGPASFNAEMKALGHTVVSVDPIYQFSADQIRQRVQATYDPIISQVRQNSHRYRWHTLALIIVSATQAERSASSVRCNPYGTGL